jgi:hypothetical protein
MVAKTDRVSILIDRLFMVLLVGVCGFGVKFLSDTATALHCLNERVAVLSVNVETVVGELGKHSAELGKHETRLDLLEAGKAKPPKVGG